MTESVSGFLLINKEKGMTSHDVVNKVRRILNIKKVGHAGTLDPNAQGVLLVAVGKATKYIQYLNIPDKWYEAQILFGKCTDTDDITGKVIKENESHVTVDGLKSVLPKFTGTIQQIPPAYSAIQIGGRHLYDYARNGQDVEIPSRMVTVFELTCTDHTHLPDEAYLKIHCSKGTYIRSLCRDLGKALNTVACMGDLIRVREGIYGIENAVTLSELSFSVEKSNLHQVMIPIETALQHYNAVQTTERGLRFVANGGELFLWNSETSFENFLNGQILRIMHNDRFIGLGSYTDMGDHPCVKPLKML